MPVTALVTPGPDVTSATPMPLPPESITFGAVLVLTAQHVVAYAITVWSFVKWAPGR